MNSIALACTGVLGLLLFVLGLTISVVRSRVGLLSGYAPEPDQLLTKLVRAHGNTAEYAPFFAVLFLHLGSRNPPHWQLWCMAGATACRLLLVVSLLAWPTMSKPNPARAIGALGTYGFGVALCVALLIGR
ncbi:MAPEG family protein [Paraburkholderia sp. RL18-103-BIB-C]|uniref:MAPEG family protein n=1 Tax=unclassified Paraburkholderia TaxID=2615204 RepID=UPI0038B966A6